MWGTIQMRVAAASLFFLLVSREAPAQTTVVKLWPNGAPGSEHWRQKELESKGNAGFRRFRNVVDPSITVYLPDRERPTGAGAIIAPGGAFRLLAWDTEGTMTAEWLRQHSIAAFVL